MTLLHYLGPDGRPVPVSAENPLPSGASAVDVEWGSITGTLSDQTDLQSALDGKAASSHNHDGTYATAAQGALADTAVQPDDLAAVATSGSYNDLSDRPAIPTVPVAEYVDPDSATVADVVNALIAAGLMASGA